VIRNPGAADEAAWRRLWADYVAFYRAAVPEPVTAATWRRILDPAAPIFARLAERDGAVVGFSVCVVHDATWSLGPVCYLEDLFVAEAARGHGIGRALIEDLLARGAAGGWARLYWHTEATNAAARRLYDGFARADGYVRYRIALAP